MTKTPKKGQKKNIIRKKNRKIRLYYNIKGKVLQKNS